MVSIIAVLPKWLIGQQWWWSTVTPYLFHLSKYDFLDYRGWSIKLFLRLPCSWDSGWGFGSANRMHLMQIGKGPLPAALATWEIYLRNLPKNQAFQLVWPHGLAQSNPGTCREHGCVDTVGSAAALQRFVTSLVGIKRQQLCWWWQIPDPCIQL